MFYLIFFYLLRFRGSEKRIEYLYFSILALCAFCYETSCLLIYTQNSIGLKTVGQLGQLAASSFFVFYFMQFSQAFLGRKLPVWIRGYYVLIVLATILAFLPVPHPFGFSKTVLHETTIRFGAIVLQTYQEAQGGIFTQLCLVVDFIGIGIVVWFYITTQLKINSTEKKYLLNGVLLFLVCVVNDTMVSFSVYHFFYTVEFGYLSIVFGMAASLTIREVESRKRLHQSEVRLAFEQKKLDMTLNAIPEAVITVSPDGRLVMCNLSFWNLIGEKKESGLPLSDYFTIKKRNEETDQNPVDILMPFSKTGLNRETFHIVPASGTTRTVEVSGSVIQHDSPEFAGSVYVLSDITEKNRLETELVRLEKLDSLGTLAAGIAHDFNNTLAGVLGNITMCKLDIPQNSPPVRMLENAEKAIMKARNLTQQLIFFSSVPATGDSSCDIAKVITDVSEFVFAGKKIKPVLDFFASRLFVHAAEADMSRVFQNLFLNSSDAMPEGGTIRISVKPQPENESVAEVKIGDTGCGIEPEALDRIFDPFYTTKKTGTGLGLFAVHSVLNRIGGSISVESIPGRGTVFTILLPAHAQPATQGESHIVSPSVHHGKILIVDDDDLIRKTCALLTQRLGYTTETAANGDQAVALYRKAVNSREVYDVVLLDLIIPGEKGGESIFEELKGINPEIQAIVMSGTISKETATAMAARGIKGMLHKPFTINELSSRLRECLPPHQHSDAIKKHDR
jgi:PAS domain S-box-containing protein